MINKKEFIEKAKTLEPKLRKEKVSPIRIVSFEQDSSGDTVISYSRNCNELNQMSLGKGEKIVLDFGDHQVGYLSLGLATVGSHYDAPAFIKIKFAEMPSELFGNSEEYRGWISSSWIQEEYMHVDRFPCVIDMPRRYAFRYVQIEVIDTSAKYQLTIQNASVTAVSSADMSKN